MMRNHHAKRLSKLLPQFAEMCLDTAGHSLSKRFGDLLMMILLLLMEMLGHMTWHYKPLRATGRQPASTKLMANKCTWRQHI